MPFFSAKYQRRKLINKPFNRLDPKVRAIFILHLAGFTQREIRKLLITDMNFVNRAIAKAYEEYDNEFNNI